MDTLIQTGTKTSSSTDQSSVSVTVGAGMSRGARG